MRLAFVLLSTVGQPDCGEVLKAYSKLAPGGPALQAGASDEAQDSVQEYRIGEGDTVHVALMSTPVPDGEADAAARFSISSFGTGWTLPAHRAHLVVVFQEAEERTAHASLRIFTWIVAAVAAASHALGVYWGAARATHSPKFFVDVAAHDEDHLMLWTGVRVTAEPPNRVSLLTLGMSQLEQPEVLLSAPRGAGNDALRFLFDTLAYFIRRGGPVPDGDTVGRTAREKLPVRWEVSPLDPEKQVVRIELPDEHMVAPSA